ncbi:uncharacterized protein ASCRUDRAFT_105304 [Ascoidea rubescens DSM 1968]|uniref:Uncharacterized protein n=1 Tax=Ascoidea rubescens DSM 1968 TaxID=1344418 RepID=A0A1D2VS98_9ASCO|nr:hypothetical protein ASCRUDRAFT_105304 [Ascoidea rubescens DSM 1968]ODV64445.1 hypothetical protein ASCRUDRAFT_105304 [Ascoidea rubescens DSM 1968]
MGNKKTNIEIRSSTSLPLQTVSMSEKSSIDSHSSNSICDTSINNSDANLNEIPTLSIQVRFNCDESDNIRFKVKNESEDEGELITDFNTIKNNTARPLKRIDRLIDLPLPKILNNDNNSDTNLYLNWQNLNNNIDPNILNFNDLIFPIPLSLINLLNKITKLCNHNNFFREKKIFARNFPKICTDFEDRLLNWRINWNLYYYDCEYNPSYNIIGHNNHDNNNNDNNKNSRKKMKFFSIYHELVYHNIMSFYNSMLIYYYKIIKKYPAVLLSYYATNSINHLKRIYEIIQKNYHDDKFLNKKMFYFKPFFLQIFFTSCEASSIDLQEKCKQLWEKYNKYEKLDVFNNNNWKAKQVIFEIWKKRNESNQDLNWVEVLKEWNFTLFLV